MTVRTEFPPQVGETPDMGIVLSDGCRLSARVWMPVDAGAQPVPAILEYIPYCKRDGTLPRDELMHPYFVGLGLRPRWRAPDWGQIMLDGRDIRAASAASFNPAKRLMEQVLETSVSHGIMTKAQAEDRAVSLFRQLSLPRPETIGARCPPQVSGGQLQRVTPAMALCPKPDLVAFDELTAALDVTTQIDVLPTIKRAIHETGVAARKPPAPSVQGVTARYKGSSFDALKNVTFDLAPGQTLAVLGESGLGKSSLARAITGLLPPARGVSASQAAPCRRIWRTAAKTICANCR